MRDELVSAWAADAHLDEIAARCRLELPARSLHRRGQFGVTHERGRSLASENGFDPKQVDGRARDGRVAGPGGGLPRAERETKGAPRWVLLASAA